jgi:hypothetical protein
MNTITTIGFLAVVAGIFVGTGNLLTGAFADQPDDPDCWGEESSELARSGETGEHASDPDPDEEGHETPRQGIGNLAGHPSEVGEALNEGDCEED